MRISLGIHSLAVTADEHWGGFVTDAEANAARISLAKDCTSIEAWGKERVLTDWGGLSSATCDYLQGWQIF